MPVQPTSAPATDIADPSAENVRYYRRNLHDLIDMAMDLARTVHAKATTPEPSEPPESGRSATPAADPIVAFDRISRAIRRTIALAQRLDDPPRTAAQHQASARKCIIREVEDAILRRPAKPGEQDRLETELQERLDSPDLDDDIFHRPVAEIIAEICRDLGIASPPGPLPWKRRTPADIAELCARAARPRPPQNAVAEASPPAGQSPTSDILPDQAEQPERVFRFLASPDRG